MAAVAESKILGYLLSPIHPDGRAKYTFFVRFGFSRYNPDQLRNALVRHANRYDVVAAEETTFGTRYVIEGALDSPDGRNPNIRVVWFVDSGDIIPRLVTAYARPSGV